VSASAVIDLRSSRSGRLAARLRAEDGVGLVELLIAILVLNVGIFATIGAFSSAGATIRRASHISTAAAIADQEINALRNMSYANIVNASAFTWPSAPDGRTYTVQVAVTSGSGVQVTNGSANLKQATVTVYDGSVVTATKLLVTSTSTFSRCTQSGLQNDSGTTPCVS
jgi:Tfp pilus assembly protein PilV